MRLTHTKCVEALQLCAVYNLYYQITREPISGTMCVASEHTMKSKDKVIIIKVPSYTGKYITHLLLTDGSKRAIFPGHSFVLR